MWAELVAIYGGKANPAMTSQKMYSLQGELRWSHLRREGKHKKRDL